MLPNWKAIMLAMVVTAVVVPLAYWHLDQQNSTAPNHPLLTQSQVHQCISAGVAMYNENHPNSTINVTFYVKAVMNYFWSVENTTAFKQNITRDNNSFSWGMASNTTGPLNETLFEFDTSGQNFYNYSDGGNLYYHNFAWTLYFGSMREVGPAVTTHPVIYIGVPYQPRDSSAAAYLTTESS